MSTIDPSYNELIKAFELINNTIPAAQETRLYYDNNGMVIGIWNSDYPPGENFIVIENTDIFQKHNTHQLRVVNKEIKIIDIVRVESVKLQKSKSGQAVVRGHAALAINPDEYPEIEYYDRANS